MDMQMKLLLAVVLPVACGCRAIDRVGRILDWPGEQLIESASNIRL